MAEEVYCPIVNPKNVRVMQNTTFIGDCVPLSTTVFSDNIGDCFIPLIKMRELWNYTTSSPAASGEMLSVLQFMVQQDLSWEKPEEDNREMKGQKMAADPFFFVGLSPKPPQYFI